MCTYVCTHSCMYRSTYVCLSVCIYDIRMYECEATGKEFISRISTVILIDNRIGARVYENKITLSRAHDSKNNIPTQN